MSLERYHLELKKLLQANGSPRADQMIKFIFDVWNEDNKKRENVTIHPNIESTPLRLSLARNECQLSRLSDIFIFDTSVPIITAKEYYIVEICKEQPVVKEGRKYLEQSKCLGKNRRTVNTSIEIVGKKGGVHCGVYCEYCYICIYSGRC